MIGAREGLYPEEFSVVLLITKNPLGPCLKGILFYL
jgi:hypothetical protein